MSQMPSAGAGPGPAQAPSAPAPASAEPTSAEPTAVAAAAAAAEPAPAYPGADTFAWDTWDGKPDALPDPVRPWHERFDKRYKTQEEHARLQHQEDLAKHQAMTNQWKRIAENGYTGQEDPRIAEATEKATRYEAAFQRYQEEQKAEFEQINKEFERTSGDYYDLVVRTNKDFFAKITPEIRAELEGALDHLSLHTAVEYAVMGPEVLKEAIELAKKGADTSVIDRIIQAERTAAKAGTAPRAPNPAAGIVAGARPTQPPPTVPTQDRQPTSTNDRLMMAARKAIALDARSIHRA